MAARQLLLDLATVEERQEACRQYLVPLGWPKRRVAVLGLFCGHGQSKRVLGQRASELAISRERAAVLIGMSKNSFAAGVADLERMGLLSVNRETQPWFYLVNWDRVAQLEPPEKREPVPAATKQNLFDEDWSPPTGGEPPGRPTAPVTPVTPRSVSVNPAPDSLKKPLLKVPASCNPVPDSMGGSDRGDQAPARSLERPWDRRRGVSDRELVAAVAHGDLAFLSRMFEVAVELGWVAATEGSQFRFLVICHHVATSAGLNRSRKGALVARMKQGLDVNRTRQMSDDWAARMMKEQYRDPELARGNCGR